MKIPDATALKPSVLRTSTRTGPRTSHVRYAPSSVSGLVASRLRGLPWEEAGRIGAVAAVLCLETLGPQAKRWTLEELLERYAESFGGPLSETLAGRLRGAGNPGGGGGSVRGSGRLSLLD